MSTHRRPHLPACWVTGRRRRFVAVLGAVLLVLAVTNVLVHVGSVAASLLLGPVVAGALLLLARRSGLSWDDLGLARRTWPRGVLVSLVSAAVVAGGYALAAALPFTHSAFSDPRYQLPLDRALFTATVVIPLGTVLVEEVAFRGVLLGLFARRRGARWGVAVSSVLFGLWHVLPSLGLGTRNAAVGSLGSDLVTQLEVVAGVVAFTGVAGVLMAEIRRRSGSLLASAGFHWAVNGIGVLASSLIFAATARA